MIGKSKKEKKDMDNVFDFETVGAPVEAVVILQKSELAWWERDWILAAVAVSMAVIDGFFLFDMLDFVLTQNAALGYIGSIGIAAILNFIPLYIAKQVNNARFRLDKNAWIFAVIGIVIFAVLYAGVVILRFHCLELYTADANRELVNKAAADGTAAAVSEEAIARAKMTALLLAVEPLATSAFSFGLAILTDNPLRRKMEALEKRLAEIRIARNRVSAALASMWEDKEFLLENDAMQLEIARSLVEDDASRLRAEARMMLAEKLGDPSSISYLASAKEDEVSTRIITEPGTGAGTLTMGPAEKQIA